MNVYTTPFWGTTNPEIVNASWKFANKGTYWYGPLVQGSLVNLQNNEIVLINGHGASGSLMLSETSNGTGASYGVQWVAQWLTNANLPANHVKIKILGCETAAFAKWLAITLRHTHPNIVVGGYIHQIYIGNGHRSLIRVPGNQYPVANTTNSGYVVWYNAQGNPVPKP